MSNIIGNEQIDPEEMKQRIEELEGEQAEALRMDAETGYDGIDGPNILAWEAEGFGNELDTLREAAGEFASYVEDWEYDGGDIIHNDHFNDYIRELAKDCYVIPKEWPFRCIDWEQAAQEAREDYTELIVKDVEENTHTYLVR